MGALSAVAGGGLKVWITRAEPGAGETATRVSALGRHPIVAPLLTVQRLLHQAPDLTGVGALAFTSANAVRAFADICPRRDLPVFAVGDATAASALQAGFADVHSSQGDVATLAADIVRRRQMLGGAVLHAGAAEPAGDLAGELQAAGVAVRTLALYRTVIADPPTSAVLSALAGVDAVLLHSPKAARALAALAKACIPPLDLSGAHLLGLSPACLAPLVDLAVAGRRVAQTPNDADLLALLQILPPQPAASPAARPVFTPVVWICLLFGALCILAGAAVGFEGARCSQGPAPCRTHPAPRRAPDTLGNPPRPS